MGRAADSDLVRHGLIFSVTILQMILQPIYKELRTINDKVSKVRSNGNSDGVFASSNATNRTGTPSHFRLLTTAIRAASTGLIIAFPGHKGSSNAGKTIDDDVPQIATSLLDVSGQLTDLLCDLRTASHTQPEVRLGEPNMPAFFSSVTATGVDSPDASLLSPLRGKFVWSRLPVIDPLQAVRIINGQLRFQPSFRSLKICHFLDDFRLHVVARLIFIHALPVRPRRAVILRAVPTSVLFHFTVVRSSDHRAAARGAEAVAAGIPRTSVQRLVRPYWKFYSP